MNLTEIFENKLKVSPEVISIDSLFNDEGRVKKTQYAPPYQRNYVWDGEKATYFLESILIGTEIPPLIFFRNGSKREIIDGRQRYETILRFLRGELRLSKAGLKKLDVLNIDKKSFNDLDEDLKNDFLDTKLRTIEYSFHSREGITQQDEDLVKQVIFKRYNTGITPLKEHEIDKAIYFEDDLNTFFKEKLKEDEFHNLFNTLFKYEDKKVEISLKKIRQLLVLHMIPIRYYSIAKQKVIDKYYDLLSAQIREEEFDDLFASFQKKLALIDEVRGVVDSEEFPYNRLISETLFWAFSIMEENDVALPEPDSIELAAMAELIHRNLPVFEMDRSSFANQIVTRYRLLAEHLKEVFGINMEGYIDTSDEFKEENRKLNQPKEDDEVSYQDLRINKPEPSSNTIMDICRQMSRNRFLVRPPYQREEVIDRKKSSEIIESILLGIKLPPIFIFKHKNGISEVIDGQQRILSILAFLGKSYVDENGNEVKTKKDGFSLQLKDSILTYLDKKKFDQLSEAQQDIITSYGLWLIEISEKNNPNFAPLDLFIRLNYKPCPVKDDTFEMWNSYIDRGLINTIKYSYENNEDWFYMRRKGNRMENENNYTVLSYFNYLYLNPGEGSEKGPLDIYRLFGRISFRLRSKREISKILEDAGKKDAFEEAVNDFEFSFIRSLRVLLSDEKDDNDKTLSKNLDELLGVENNKRTQQSFYVLWYFLHGLDGRCFKENKKIIRQEVRALFNSMSSEGITVESFNKKVDGFRESYKRCSEPETIFAKIEDVARIYSFDPEHSIGEPQCDFYVMRDNKMLNRVEIVEIPTMDKGASYGVRVRDGFTKGYLEAILQSNFIFREFDFANRNVTIGTLKSIDLPVLPIEKQRLFDKVMVYTYTHNYIQSRFFENLLDRMVEEVYHQELFRFQNVTLFEQVRKLEDLQRFAKDDSLDEQIDKVYYSLTKESDGLLSSLAGVTGVTGSYGGPIEK